MKKAALHYRLDYPQRLEAMASPYNRKCRSRYMNFNNFKLDDWLEKLAGRRYWQRRYHYRSHSSLAGSDDSVCSGKRDGNSRRGTIAAVSLSTAGRVGYKRRCWLKTAARLSKGRLLVEIKGPARAILSGERLRLKSAAASGAGIATCSSTFVSLVAAYPVRIVDTREDDSGVAAVGKICGACRRRLQSSSRTLRCRADQRQSYQGSRGNKAGNRGCPKKYFYIPAESK